MFIIVPYRRDLSLWGSSGGELSLGVVTFVARSDRKVRAFRFRADKQGAAMDLREGLRKYSVRPDGRSLRRSRRSLFCP